MKCGPHRERGLPPETSSEFTHRRGSSLALPPNSGLRSPNVTTITGLRTTRSDYQHEVRDPYGR
eukprot:8203566-Pyramimonas_sp.AAC.1